MINIFVSCHFPVSDFVKQCKEIGKAMDVNMITLDETVSNIPIAEKIKNALNQCSGVLFVLEPIPPDHKNNCTPYMGMEYGMATDLRLPYAIINNSSLGLPSIFPSEKEHLPQENGVVPVVRIVGLFNSLKKEISVKSPDQAPFVRKFLKQQILINEDGSVTYATMVSIKCLVDGVKDLHHSIYLPYSHCWNEGGVGCKPEIEIVDVGEDNYLTLKEEANNDKKYTWSFEIQRPLRTDESFKYGYRVAFPKYFPYTYEQLEKNTIDSHPDPYTIFHQFFISHPTEELHIELKFGNGEYVQDFQCFAFNGRSLSKDALNHRETERIQSNLEISEFLNGKNVVLKVSNPLFGRGYVIGWRLKKRKN